MYTAEQISRITEFFNGNSDLTELFILISKMEVKSSDYDLRCNNILAVREINKEYSFYVRKYGEAFKIRFKDYPVDQPFKWDNPELFKQTKGALDTISVKRFSANYLNTDCNFEIYNLPDGNVEGEDYSIFCVLQNILQRGSVTGMSRYLKDQLGSKSYRSEERFHFFSKFIPDWTGAIKGYEPTLRYPAADFYYNVVPDLFGNCFQQMLIPEVKITDIVYTEAKAFINQTVDFYLPQMKLVIEIDGSQHMSRSQAALDDKRDNLFRKSGVEIFRIQAKDIHNTDAYIYLKEYVAHYKDVLDEYEKSFTACLRFKNIAEQFQPVLAIRFQILLLELLKAGTISIGKTIKIAVKSTENCDYIKSSIDDLFIWLKNLYQLIGKRISQPETEIIVTEHFNAIPSDYIKIDISLCNKITNPKLLHSDVIYVATCWNQEKDYYEVQTAEKLKYNFGDDSMYDAEDYSNEFGGINARRLALRFMLQNITHFDEFRHGQERIIINALEGRDTIGVLPTGSGKSLCYQLTILLQPGISFCICPIKALMIDQHRNLLDMQISRVQYIMSSQETEEREDILRNFSNRKYQLTFIAPERFQSEDFRNRIGIISKDDNNYFGYAVIDEVHCMSDWGHDFRPSYLNLVKTIRKYCGDIILFGLTATASLNVLKNIEIEFDLKDRRNIVSVPEFTRQELNFDIDQCTVNNKSSVLIEKLTLWKDIDDDVFMPNGKETRCGIVFTPNVNKTYGCFPLAALIAKKLRADVRGYAGSEPNDWDSEKRSFEDYKKEVQQDFKDNRFSLLCATKAFGMGIDKPNVRYTIHYGIPASLEALYQEAGRAGRDKESAYCWIIYSPEYVDVKNDLLNAMGSNSTELFRNTLKSMHYNQRGDINSQAFLLSEGMQSDYEELELATYILDLYKESGCEIVDNAPFRANNRLQKVIYHLAIIGVIEDWTVDWKKETITVYFTDKCNEEIFATMEAHIHKYDAEYDVRKLFAKVVETYEGMDYKAQVVLTFWEWYKATVLYSRKEALKNVIESCDEFVAQKKDNPTKAANNFKDKMESYFRLDDIADRMGEVADFPREYEKWFKILNLNVIEKKKIRGLIANLSRFLESYQNNIGLNFISGILNLLNHNFDTENGRNRLRNSLGSINSFDEDAKLYILTESSKLIKELGDETQKKEFAEFFIENYDLKNVAAEIYKVVEDNYSLNVAFLQNLAELKSMLEEG